MLLLLICNEYRFEGTLMFSYLIAKCNYSLGPMLGKNVYIFYMSLKDQE